METFAVVFPVLLLSVVAHEYAHARVAVAQGDPTPQTLGRLTLNPIPHIDPIGSVAVPLLLLLLPGNLLFGWAKPVPTIPRNYRNYKRGDILVSSAGVITNLVLAVGFTVLAVLIGASRAAILGYGGPLEQMVVFGIWINIILAVFNLLPIPPLDGSHLFYYLLPPHWGARYRALGHQYGILIVALFIMIPGFGQVVLTPAIWLWNLTALVGL